MLDDQHILILTSSTMKYARIKVQIIRNSVATNGKLVHLTTNNHNNENHDDMNSELPEPILVAKVSLIKIVKYKDT